MTLFQPAFTCSKLTVKTLEQGVKHVHANGVVLVSLLLTLNIFHAMFKSFYYQLWSCNCRLGYDFRDNHMKKKSEFRALLLLFTFCKSHTEVFYEKGLLKNVAKVTEKHLCRSLFLKNEIPTQEFFCEFCTFFQNTFFIEHLLWLHPTFGSKTNLKFYLIWFMSLILLLFEFPLNEILP